MSSEAGTRTNSENENTYRVVVLVTLANMHEADSKAIVEWRILTIFKLPNSSFLLTVSYSTRLLEQIPTNTPRLSCCAREQE